MFQIKTNKDVMKNVTFDNCTELNKIDDELEAVADNKDTNYDDEHSGNNQVSSLPFAQGI